MISRRSLLKGVGIIGLSLILPGFKLKMTKAEDVKQSTDNWPGKNLQLKVSSRVKRNRARFDPNLVYGRGIEYGGDYKKTDVVEWVKNMAERQLPEGTPYLVVDDPWYDIDPEHIIKGIYWIYHPGLTKRKFFFRSFGWTYDDGVYKPPAHQTIIGLFKV